MGTILDSHEASLITQWEKWSNDRFVAGKYELKTHSKVDSKTLAFHSVLEMQFEAILEEGLSEFLALLSGG